MEKRNPPRGRKAILQAMKKGDVWYTKLPPKDITSACTLYNIKNIKTERCLLVHYSSRSGGEEKSIEDLTVVYKN